MAEGVDQRTRNLSEQRAGPDEDVPRVPAQNAAEVDADGAQPQGDEHEEPRVTRAGGASHDRLNQVERHEPKQETRRRRRPDQQTFVPEGLAGDVRQVSEVRDDVGRVREEQQPEEAECQHLDSPRAAPVAVVDEQCKPERDPGEEKVPEKRHFLERMRVCDTESDEPGNQAREPNKRAEDNQTAVAEGGAESVDHTSRLARRLGTRTDHLRVTKPLDLRKVRATAKGGP